MPASPAAPNASQHAPSVDGVGLAAQMGSHQGVDVSIRESLRFAHPARSSTKGARSSARALRARWIKTPAWLALRPSAAADLLQGMSETLQLQGRSLLERQPAQSVGDRLFQLTVHGGPLRPQGGAVHRQRPGVQAQHRAAACLVVDAGVGDGGEQQLATVARQVVDGGLLEQPAVAVLHDVLRGGPIGEQADGVGDGVRGRGQHPGVEVIVRGHASTLIPCPPSRSGRPSERNNTPAGETLHELSASHPAGQVFLMGSSFRTSWCQVMLR